MTGKHVVQAEKVCRAGAEGNQHIHIGAERTQRQKAMLIKPPANDELYRRCQD